MSKDRCEDGGECGRRGSDSGTTEIGIIGNGPSAMILSYILSGNIPYYDPTTIHGPHPDCTLHQMLSDYQGPGIGRSLIAAVRDCRLLAYVSSSYASFYSAAMLDFNLLLDTLVSSDESDFSSSATAKQTRIRWAHDPKSAVCHCVIGSSKDAGGQWARMTEADAPEELSLSYAEMVSLPGYSFSDFYSQKYHRALPDFTRPTRGDVAEFYSLYPKRVGIERHFIASAVVTAIERLPGYLDAFTIAYHHLDDHHRSGPSSLRCKQVVLATGIFEDPQHKCSPSFSQLSKLITQATYEEPITDNFTLTPPLTPTESSESTQSVLVIGSGVSAAEAVHICQDADHIYHIYKWIPGVKSSPLRRYPKELYPEYATVYQAMAQCHTKGFKSPLRAQYHGLRNASVVDISRDGHVQVEVDGKLKSFQVDKIKVRTGRAGSLDFVRDIVQDSNGQNSSCASQMRSQNGINRHSLRQIPHFTRTLTIAPNVYAVGSLTGDTLIRFTLGGCLVVASYAMLAS